MRVETSLARIWDFLANSQQRFVYQPTSDARRERRNARARIKLSVPQCHGTETVVEDQVQLGICEGRSRERIVCVGRPWCVGDIEHKWCRL